MKATRISRARWAALEAIPSMGLEIVFGVFPESYSGDDPEWEQEIRANFRQVNHYLRAIFLSERQEPEKAAYDQVFSFTVCGYFGLHYLRRLAAQLRAGVPPNRSVKAISQRMTPLFKHTMPPVLQSHHEKVQCL